MTDQLKSQGKQDEMPQSAAIQEKLRRFEATNDAKPFGSHQSNTQNYKPKLTLTSEKSKEVSPSLGRGLIDETNRVNFCYFTFTRFFLIYFTCAY